MQLMAAIFLYAGGPGSGCTGPDCGRKPGAQPLDIAQKQEDNPSKRFMRLQLTGGGHLPLLFENDSNLTWNWIEDRKVLHIEQVETKMDEYPTGFTEKQVVDVPVANVREWTPTDGEQWKN